MSHPARFLVVSLFLVTLGGCSDTTPTAPALGADPPRLSASGKPTRTPLLTGPFEVPASVACSFGVLGGGAHHKQPGPYNLSAGAKRRHRATRDGSARLYPDQRQHWQVNHSQHVGSGPYHHPSRWFNHSRNVGSLVLRADRECTLHAIHQLGACRDQHCTGWHAHAREPEWTRGGRLRPAVLVRALLPGRPAGPGRASKDRRETAAARTRCSSRRANQLDARSK